MGIELTQVVFLCSAVSAVLSADKVGLSGMEAALFVAAVSISATALWLYSPLPNRMGMVMGGTGAGYWGFSRPDDADESVKH